MLVSDLFVHIRDGLGSAANARWSDAELLRVAQVAVERSQAILQRNGISFGRKSLDITTTAGIDAYDVPGDFAAVLGMTRLDTAQPMRHVSQLEWDTLMSAQPLSVFCIDGEVLRVASAPTSAVTLRLRYWPTRPALTLAGSTPWNGKLDSLLVDYARARLFNTDEMDVSQDVQLLQDLENNILAQFAASEPTVVQRRGWLV